MDTKKYTIAEISAGIVGLFGITVSFLAWLAGAVVFGGYIRSSLWNWRTRPHFQISSA
jgi:hypothetical protein